MFDLTQDFTQLMEMVNKAKALKQELDYLKDNGIIDEHQYNILLNSHPDMVEKIVPKIYDQAIKQMQLEQEAQLKQAEMQQPKWRVEFVKGDKGIKMVIFDERNPWRTMQEKWLTKSEAKKTIQELNKKWKAQVIGGKVVYIPPTPEEDIVVKDLGIQTGRVTTSAGATAGGGKPKKIRLHKVYSSIAGAKLIDDEGNFYDVIPIPKDDGTVEIGVKATSKIEFDENRLPRIVPISPEEQKKKEQQVKQVLQEDKSFLQEITETMSEAVKSGVDFVKGFFTPDTDIQELKQEENERQQFNMERADNIYEGYW